MTPNEQSPPAENPLAEGLLNERSPDPFIIVIFGATGDLTARKLIPALFALCADGRLPQRFAIVGAARREKSDSEFREEMAAALEKHSTRARADGAETPADWENFARRLFYHRMSFDDAGAYATLARRLAEVDAELGLPGNRLFYLSTRPSQFAVVLDQLREAGMARPPGKSSVWRRVIIEKPFGRDRDSARELNRQVGETLDESQVFRIDHYLGKETVQNLMTFRFANAIFEPLWNRNHVASIQITAAETVGMEGGRGGYYDSAGALRDMVQNHLFQLLSLVAMEPPSRFDADAIRDGKVNVLRTLEPMTPDEVALNTVRGQYGKGSLMGAEVDAYRDQPGVDPRSQTETYVALRLKLDNWRWAGVPFLLRTGKRMPKRATEIAIQFRLPPVGLFKRRLARPAAKGGEWLAPNILLLHLQPDEGISLMFDAKTPGMTMEVQPVKMDFRYGTSFANPSPEAYERLLLDALIGDSTLFTRNDEVDAAWEFITSVHEGWAASPPADFPNYPAGDWGPPEADRLIHPGEGAWRRL